jgi:hypothetical protein
MLNINTFWMCALTDIPYVLHKLSLLPTGRTQKLSSINMISPEERITLKVEENRVGTSNGGAGRRASSMPSFLFSREKAEISLITQTLQFIVYYPQLRVRVLLGFHQTPNPLNLRWRWDYRKYRNVRTRARPH